MSSSSSSSPSPSPSPDPALRGFPRIVLYGYAAAALIPVLLLLVFLVGSLLFSGAQVTLDDRPRYGAPIPFPLFVVPDWLSIGCAVITAVLVIPLMATTSVGWGGRLVGMLSYSGGAFIADGLFAFAFPSETGPLPTPADPEVFLGNHIFGAGLSLLCAIILFVRIAVTDREYKRLRAAGELPEGQF